MFIDSLSEEQKWAMLKQILTRAGVRQDKIDRAKSEGQLGKLVIDSLILISPRTLTEKELIAETGMSEELSHKFWRSLGFPEVDPDVKNFNELDLEAATTLRAILDLEITDSDKAIQLTRVIGSSMSRIAEATVGLSQSIDDKGDDLTSALLIALALDLVLPAMGRILEYAFRRHLHEASSRHYRYRIQNTGENQIEIGVGFADMVGFTFLAQHVGADELARVVERFETISFDTVVAQNGRVVKMIGDEVMFIADQPTDLANIALNLRDRYSDDDLLTDVRVGLSYGPVLNIDGDYYGPVVNRASRIVNIAAAGSILVSSEIKEMLASNQEFKFIPLRPRVLKDIGRAELYVLRKASESDAQPTSRNDRWSRIADILSDLEALRDTGSKFLSSVREEKGNELKAPDLKEVLKRISDAT